MAEHPTSSTDIVRRGEQLYSARLQAALERDHWGQFVAIDVDSGEFEVADEDWQATRRLRDRLPGCMTYGVRIGSDVAYAFQRRTQADDA